MNNNWNNWEDRTWLGDVLGTADWKEGAAEIVPQMNKQLRWHQSPLRLRYRELVGGWSVTLTGKDMGSLDIAHGTSDYADDVLDELDNMLRQWGIRVKDDLCKDSDTVVWVLRRDRRLRGGK